MNNPHHISERLETIFWVKILKFVDADPESGMKKIWIQDGKELGSGIRKKHPGSATLSPRKSALSKRNRAKETPKIYKKKRKETCLPCCSLLESLDECTDLPEGELAYESLTIVHKVLGILRDWTRGDGLTDDQVEAIDAYYTSLKDCDYLGRSFSRCKAQKRQSARLFLQSFGVGPPNPSPASECVPF
jgi:hypothetical protein